MNVLRVILYLWVLGCMTWPQISWGQATAEDCKSLDQVPSAVYAEADRLFEEGNQYAEEFLFDDAIASYEESLSYWKDPLVYYNLSRAYVAMKRPLEAYHSIVAATRCGPGPLAEAPDEAEQAFISAVELRDELLTEELGALVLVSKESDIQVITDDQPKRPLNERHSEVLMPTTHSLEVEKEGHVSRSMAVTPPRGQTLTLEVKSERTIPEWLPWTILGVGGVLGGTGAILYANGFAGDATDLAVCTPNCPASGDSEVPRDPIVSGLGIGGMVVGGTVLLAGLGLFWWNPSPTLQISPVKSSAPKIIPSVSEDGVGVSGQFTF